MFNWLKKLFKKKKIKIRRPADWPLPANYEEPEFFDGNLYIIGDSHAQYPFRDCTFCNGMSMGPRTAHKLDTREGEVIQNLRHRPAGSKFIFIFGEIDCRVHFFNQANKQQRPIDDLILDTAERYVILVKRLRRRGFDIAVMNVVPTGEMGNAGYKFFGAPSQRREITKKFNNRLECLCLEHGVPFINIYKELVNGKGWRKRELIQDDVHLNGGFAKILENNLRKHWWMYE